MSSLRTQHSVSSELWNSDSLTQVLSFTTEPLRSSYSVDLDQQASGNPADQDAVFLTVITC